MSSISELWEKVKSAEDCQRSDCLSESEVDLETINLHGVELDIWLCRKCKEEIFDY